MYLAANLFQIFPRRLPGSIDMINGSIVSTAIVERFTYKRSCKKRSCWIALEQLNMVVNPRALYVLKCSIQIRFKQKPLKLVEPRTSLRVTKIKAQHRQ